MSVLLEQQNSRSRRLIQHQIVLILHARQCKDRGSPCHLPPCATMVNILEHMETCHADSECSYINCCSSRRTLAHWRSCTWAECPVCEPLNTFWNPARWIKPTNNMGNLLLMAPRSQEGSSSQGPTGGPGSQQGPPPPTGSVGGAAGAHLTGAQAAPGGNPIYRFDCPSPEIPNAPQEWHQQVSKDLRNHLTGRVVKGLFPNPYPAAIHHRRVRDLISYARKVEKEVFEASASRDEYYHSIAERIYQLQRILRQKIEERFILQGAWAGQLAPQQSDVHAVLDELMGRGAQEGPSSLGQGPSGPEDYEDSENQAPSSLGQGPSGPEDQEDSENQAPSSLGQGLTGPQDPGPGPIAAGTTSGPW